ncbi:carbohydrate ABC transporter permease [Paenarthrobacter histidinolovorans]|uniref:carbohydrate ABC transporter permease n=1 Tax=Paenarthrobacter histidinolovorans TaxID=43664 RepID=UPI00166AEACE|nr:carbohydrate ABC transporter permease [Paenarthrobacter histidinolovorans]GGJ22436.1 sugar ABC transporter permease [Paenarthrobacter histidinolovorans]
MSTSTTSGVAAANDAAAADGTTPAKRRSIFSRAANPTPAPGYRGSKKATKLEPFTVISYLGVTIFGLFALIPLWMILAGSLTAESTLARSGYSFFPEPFSLDAYVAIFSGTAVFQGYAATLFITVVGTVLSLLATASLSWVIARRMPRISRPLTIFAYLPMLFSGGLVPLYLLVTQVLQLQNNWFAVILPHMMAPFLVFVAVSFFRQLPEEILDSAKVDGAGELRVFFEIVLPLSKPILAVIGLFYAVSYWNEWFTAMLFISDPEKYPLQLMLQNLIANVTNAAMLPGSGSVAPIYQLRLALTVVTIGPILLAYPFAQRYFVKGLTLGATKG